MFKSDLVVVVINLHYHTQPCVCVCVYLVVAGHHVTQAQVTLCDVISAGEESGSVGAELHVFPPAHVPELPQHRLQLVTHTFHLSHLSGVSVWSQQVVEFNVSLPELLKSDSEPSVDSAAADPPALTCVCTHLHLVLHLFSSLFVFSFYLLFEGKLRVSHSFPTNRS